MKRLLLWATLFATLAACAGPNPSPNPRKLQMTPAVANLLESEESITLADPRIHCEQRKRVGSNFSTRMCMLESEREAAREESLRGALGNERRAGMGFKSGEG
jgi:hypothetical protein